jgi:DNA topoisomerase-1
MKIEANGFRFTTSTSNLIFDGFMSVYKVEAEEDENGISLENFNEGDVLDLDKLNPNQHFTQPPAHFTEASLVKTLEELGIGRPSTYAPTISTLLARRYILKENKNIYVTELGEAVNKIMKTALQPIWNLYWIALKMVQLHGRL